MISHVLSATELERAINRGLSNIKISVLHCVSISTYRYPFVHPQPNTTTPQSVIKQNKNEATQYLGDSIGNGVANLGRPDIIHTLKSLCICVRFPKDYIVLDPSHHDWPSSSRL